MKWIKRLAVMLLILSCIVPAQTLNVDASTEDTAIIIHPVGGTSVSYKSCSNGFPGTNNYQNSGGYALQRGELGVSAGPYDKTGTYVVPMDGTYQIELKGGGGAAAFFDCAGGRCAMGGAGGQLIIDVPLKKGDVITYTAAGGGIQASYGASRAYQQYGGNDAAVSIGASGRDTIVKVNGVEYARAGGGHGAYRFCMQSDDYTWAKNLLKAEGNYDGVKVYAGGTDDPAYGGKGGVNSYKSGVGITVVHNQAGEGGHATLLSGFSNHVGQSGLTKQQWYSATSGYSKETTPGYVLISLNHPHVWEEADSACTTAGTKDRVCKLCHGRAFGTIVVPAHGHNFVDVEMGTAYTKCLSGQQYYEKGLNAATNSVMKTWDGRPNYWFTKQCTYCKEFAEPKTAYKIRYNEGNGQQILDDEFKYYGIDYTPMKASETGWSRTGYYLAYWSYRPVLAKYNSGDEDWKPGTNGVLQCFRDVPKNNEFIVDVYAVWKPIPYTLRIHDNFQKTDQIKDYTLYYDQPFYLPGALWTHNAILQGYDWVSNVYVDPVLRKNDQVINLTTVRRAVIDIYCIWDAAPVVKTRTNEVHLNLDEARSLGLLISETAISQSQLEDKLLTYATAEDYEWGARGTDSDYTGYSGSIKPGTQKGYTFKVASFVPDKVQERDVSTFYITFECTDDAGQSGTATMTVYVSGKVDILAN